MAFQKATKRNAKARVALEGPPGSGKTYSALAIGRGLVGEQGRIAVIDTERGSASKYSDEFDFDVVELDTYAPLTFVELIREAEAEGYDLLIIDSLSHAWMGTDGMLEQVDKIAKRKQYGTSFAAWKDASPQERSLWDTILGCRMHVIATLRTKTEYVVEESEKNGRKRSVPRKVGLAPIQREGLEYEFDVVCDLDIDHTLTVSKSRCRTLDQGVFSKPGADFAGILDAWLTADSAGPEPDPAPRKTFEKPEASTPAPQDEAPEPVGMDRAELLNSMKDHIRALRLPSAVGAHLVGIRGYAKTTDMPLDLFARFVLDLATLRQHFKAEAISHGDMLDALQRFPEDGSDPLADLLDTLKTGARETAAERRAV